MQPTILLLKEGTDTSQGLRCLFCFVLSAMAHVASGVPQLISNINACQAVGEILKTTLGPRGMDKLIFQGTKVTISNDGATIIKLLDIVHPAAKTLTDIAKSQDDEVSCRPTRFEPHALCVVFQVGDGTTSVVLLACEFLKSTKTFVEDGVHPQIIIRGLRKACQFVWIVFRVC